MVAHNPGVAFKLQLKKVLCTIIDIKILGIKAEH